MIYFLNYSSAKLASSFVFTGNRINPPVIIYFFIVNEVQVVRNQDKISEIYIVSFAIIRS
jgi:hypothetical protein